MTSFNANDNGSGAAKGATSFEAEGAATEVEGAGDTTVVLEIGGRKFTKSDLIKKVTAADTHIAKLEQERQEDRRLLNEVNETLKKQVSAADILKQIKEGTQVATPTTLPAATQPVPTVEEIVAKVKQTQDAATAEQQRAANFKSVSETLTKAFGTAVNAKVDEVAASVGLTREQIVELARTSPQAALTLFPNLTRKAMPSALPANGRVNTQSHSPAPPAKSGFSQAKSTKESVAIYHKRLQELSEG